MTVWDTCLPVLNEESSGCLLLDGSKKIGNQYLFINSYVPSNMLGVLTWCISFNHISLGSQIHFRNMQRVGFKTPSSWYLEILKVHYSDTSDKSKPLFTLPDQIFISKHCMLKWATWELKRINYSGGENVWMQLADEVLVWWIPSLSLLLQATTDRPDWSLAFHFWHW